MERNYKSLTLLWRLFLIARPYWLHLSGIIVMSLLATPLTLLNPVPIKIIVDHVLGSEPLPEVVSGWLPIGWTASESALLLLAACMVAGLAALSAAQWTLAWLLQTYTGEKLALRLRTMLFGHAQQLAFAYHDQKGSTDSTYRIQYDAGAIQNILIYSLIPLLTAGFPLVGIATALLFIDWQLAVIALGASPILVLLVRLYGGRLRRRWSSVRRVDSNAMSIVQEVLSSLRMVKAYGREDDEQQRFVARSNERIRGHLGAVGLNCRFELLVAITIGTATATVLFVGVSHVQRGLLSLGELLMVMTYIGQIFGPLRQMSSSSTGLASGLASAERVFAVMDTEPGISDSANARSLKHARGNVVFDNVSFEYLPGQPVLRDISLAVPAGSRVGIQGRTGSGKSTLMSLLLRFHDPLSGRILLDGVDLREYRLKDLRHQIAIVLQEPVLFATTIRENIAYGRPGASESEIEEAARRANAHDFIAALPDGYDSLIGERGTTLSGGERQRVALARAFLRNAPILILDEPTSSVDVGTEKHIIDATNRLMEGRTTFMIAHRLSTLEQCDLMLELADGQLRVIESKDTAGRSISAQV